MRVLTSPDGVGWVMLRGSEVSMSTFSWDVAPHATHTNTDTTATVATPGILMIAPLFLGRRDQIYHRDRVPSPPVQVVSGKTGGLMRTSQRSPRTNCCQVHPLKSTV